jgi:Crp-like helix-turn-helix protein
MIGNDGAFGAGHALDGKTSLNRAVIQVAGTASAIESSRLCELALALPSLRALLMKYEQFFSAQVQQAVACNAVHSVEQRTCKWLLRMHDLVGEDLPLTQEFLAQMMGVRRTSVTEVAGGLQKQGMITYRRGNIHINDLEQVREHACECGDAIQSHYRRLFAPEQPMSLRREPLNERQLRSG